MKERILGFGRAYWPALIATGVCLGALVTGYMALPNSQQAADALEKSFLPFQALPYRLKDNPIDTDDPRRVFPAVDAYLLAGQQRTALQVLDSYLKKRPDDLEALRRAALLADWEGLPQEVARHRQEVRARDPEDEEVRKWLADYLVWKGHPDEAANVYLEVLELDNSDFSLVLRAGDALAWVGRFDEAAKVFRDAIIQKPDRLEPYVRLGRVYDWVGNANAAIEAYEGAINVNPDSLFSWFQLVRLYRATDQIDKAIDAAAQVARLS